jgi:hypothetical protein
MAFFKISVVPVFSILLELINKPSNCKEIVKTFMTFSLEVRLVADTQAFIMSSSEDS